MRPIVRFTDVTDGSFALGEDPAALRDRRSRSCPWPVTWLSQVHGNTVVVVDGPGAGCGAAADAVVTGVPGVAVSVITADCAPVVLTSPDAVAAVHAGWRGLVAGVIGAAVEQMRRFGDGPIEARLGPCIRARCYEFGTADLDVVAATLGDEVRSVTAWGTPALDVTAGVRSALRRAGVGVLHDTGVCTACSPVHFSHRARAETGRQAAFAWLEPVA